MKSAFKVSVLLSILQLCLCYEIKTSWDNVTITEHDPIQIDFSATASGDLIIEITAPFFNSPIPPGYSEYQDGNNKCIENSYYGLWEYEVVEVFFLNKETSQYIEIEISPRGRHILLLLDGYRNDIMTNLIVPFGVVIENDCFDDHDNRHDVTCKWTGSAIIPSDYLPKDVSHFNAYGIHGDPWGEASPDHVHYESLFPVAQGTANADFHYLEAFEQIDIYKLGVDRQTEPSNIWQGALTENFENLDHDVLWAKKRINASTFNHDCELAQVIATDEYQCEVTSSRNNGKKLTTFKIDVSGNPEVIPIFYGLQTPGSNESFYSFPQEAVYLLFHNDNEEFVTVGINPYGAYLIVLFRSSEPISGGQELSRVICDNYDGTSSDWHCEFDLEWDYFPAAMSHWQVMHTHWSLKDKSTGLPNTDHEMTALLCNSAKENSFNIGCEVDRRIFVDPGVNDRESQLWSGANSAQIQLSILMLLFTGIMLFR